MQLKLLQQQLDAYKQFLVRPEAEKNLYAWESQRIFQERWDLEAVDLAAMYDASLDNRTTRRLWYRENYEPKRMMLQFLRMEPEFVRSMFRDLFAEEKSIEGRAGRFVFGCDELLQVYKERHPHTVENNHYHGNDYQMIFLYLAFRFPDRYALYHFDAFIATLRKLGVSQIPLTHDLERYVKVTNTIFKFIQKDEDLLNRHRRRLREQAHFMEESLLVVYDFYQFTGGGDG